LSTDDKLRLCYRRPDHAVLEEIKPNSILFESLPVSVAKTNF